MPAKFPVAAAAARPAARAAAMVMCLAAALGTSACLAPPKLKREADAIVARVQVPAGGARSRDLMSVCRELSGRGLGYQFGSANPGNGGMDCSGTIQHVFSRLGYRQVPRQSNHQYHWVARRGRIRHAGRLDEGVLRRMRPGDLMFWRGTYATGRRWPDISHVMIYAGRDSRTGTHFMFGGRGSGRTGRSGAGIDFFEIRPGGGEGRGSRFVGWGRPPGLR
jgi:hypothetical protein